MAHHLPTENCETCGRETQMVCECCGAPCCGHCQREGSMCAKCYAKHEEDYAEWCAEQDRKDIEAMEGEGMDDEDHICECCGSLVSSEADLDDGVCETCAAEGDDVLVDEDDCPMDGDHQSALASCGLGVDEDYGCYGGEEW